MVDVKGLYIERETKEIKQNHKERSKEHIESFRVIVVTVNIRELKRRRRSVKVWDNQAGKEKAGLFRNLEAHLNARF